MCDINRTELIFYERENIPYNSNTIAALKKKMASKKQNSYCDKAFELSGIKLGEYKVLTLEQSTFFLMPLMKIISVFLGNSAPIMDSP